MSGFYTVEVGTGVFNDDFGKIWDVWVFTFLPERVKFRAVRLSLSDSTTFDSLEGFPALQKYALLSGEMSESGSPFVSGFRRPRSNLEGVELQEALLRFLHETSDKWWDGYEDIFQDVPTPHYRSLHASALSDGRVVDCKYGPREGRFILYLVYSPQD